MTGADGVFHVAGWYKVGVRDSSMAQAINVDGTRNVLELMRDLKIPKGVYTSTLAVNSDTGGIIVDETYRFHGTHISEYDRTKAAAHAVAESMIAQGLPLVIVMPGLVYGIGDTSSTRTAFVQYLQRKLPILPEKTSFAWAHVDDIVNGHILAMEKGTPGESYIIAGPVHGMIEGFRIAAGITGVPMTKLHIAPTMMKLSSALMRPLAAIMPLPEMFHPETLRITAGVTYIGSNAKAKRELGYDPRPLDVGMREWLEYEMGLLGIKK